MEPFTPTGGDGSGDGAPAISAADIHAGAFDDAIRAWNERHKRLMFDRLPRTIYLVRHGQSEGNIDPTM